VVLIDHLADSGVDDFADNRFDDRFLAGKNAIQLTDAQARLAGDIGDGSAMQPFSAKHLCAAATISARRACCFCCTFPSDTLLPPAIHHSRQYRRLS
jgi:hypothetical protein